MTGKKRSVCGEGGRRAVELELILWLGAFQLVRRALLVVSDVDAGEIEVVSPERTHVFLLEHFSWARPFEVEELLVDGGFGEIRLDGAELAEMPTAGAITAETGLVVTKVEAVECVLQLVKLLGASLLFLRTEGEAVLILEIVLRV